MPEEPTRPKAKITVRSKDGEEKTFVQCVFRIKSFNIRGVPSECVLMEDEQEINLREIDAPTFMICWVPEKMLEGTL